MRKINQNFVVNDKKNNLWDSIDVIFSVSFVNIVKYFH